MFHLVYVSSAVKPFSESELIDLLSKSREKNAQKDITGILLYNDGNFMQILEGEEAAVLQLYDIISHDQRHHGMVVLVAEQTSETIFGEWSMAFRNLTNKQIHEIPGFSRFMERTERTLIEENFKNDPTGCWDLLKFFRETSR